MSRTYIIFSLGAILIIGLFVVLQQGDTQATPSPEPNPAPAPQPTPAPPSQTEGENQRVVTYTDSGYSPPELTIQAGDTVVFRNNSSRQTWPASDIHPTHTLYPDSGIQKCGTAERDMIFDACRRLEQGEEWSFTFEERGNWRYHDHTLPGHRGRIIVE